MSGSIEKNRSNTMVALKDLFVLLVLSYQIVFLKFVIGGPTKGKLRAKVCTF